MILDASVQNQTYIEDCEVCCNPIEISPTFEAGELIGFRSESIEQ
ncbi:CPXCG motif-containing cysteine-rich protein [Polaribacter haliotis]|uniref:CPXCG motif-containing cysteine-rich protein n=2 Tax=Polaribacter haliotis TaxID=1888915 RepID=A0A7L8AH82_9FLAO|nr:CPXCG motif-containing cysteine-rich protein [Polaribacter haliotis]